MFYFFPYDLEFGFLRLRCVYGNWFFQMDIFPLIKQAKLFAHKPTLISFWKPIKYGPCAFCLWWPLESSWCTNIGSFSRLRGKTYSSLDPPIKGSFCREKLWYLWSVKHLAYFFTPRRSDVNKFQLETEKFMSWDVAVKESGKCLIRAALAGEVAYLSRTAILVVIIVFIVSGWHQTPSLNSKPNHEMIISRDHSNPVKLLPISVTQIRAHEVITWCRRGYDAATALLLLRYLWKWYCNRPLFRLDEAAMYLGPL